MSEKVNTPTGEISQEMKYHPGQNFPETEHPPAESFPETQDSVMTFSSAPEPEPLTVDEVNMLIEEHWHYRVPETRMKWDFEREKWISFEGGGYLVSG